MSLLKRYSTSRRQRKLEAETRADPAFAPASTPTIPTRLNWPRRLSLELAAKVYRAVPHDSDTQTVEELLERIKELTLLFEKDFLAMELRWRIEELRSMPYTEYVHTPEWQERRKAALGRAGHRCQVCNASGPLDVHHRTYDRRGDERADDLTVPYRQCHGLFHEVARVTSQPQGWPCSHRPALFDPRSGHLP